MALWLNTVSKTYSLIDDENESKPVQHGAFVAAAEKRA